MTSNLLANLALGLAFGGLLVLIGKRISAHWQHVNTEIDAYNAAHEWSDGVMPETTADAAEAWLASQREGGDA